MTRSLAGQVVRFGTLGAANTLVTGVVLVVLGLFLPLPVAYTIAYALGILIAVTLTPRAVFGTRPSVRRRVAYGTWYVGLYLIGLALVVVLEQRLHVDRLLATCLTVATTAIISFAGARILFTDRAREVGEE